MNQLRWVSWLVLAILAIAGASQAQESRRGSWASNVIVPQARSYAIGQAGTVQITGISAGVVIRNQAATTLLEISLRNPTATRLESELLVPVPDGAVVRGFSYQGPVQEPTARLLPRDEARSTYDRIVSQARDPALLEFAGYNLVRSSVFPVEAGGTQTVRLTYENLLRSDGDRVDYILPRSESIEYAVPWKIAVELVSKSPLTAVYSPSHNIRTIRATPTVARVQLDPSSVTDPGPFRLSFLNERNGVSASLFAYPDPKIGGGYFLLLAGLPPRHNEEKSPTIRREVTLVIDRSGSMRGEKLNQAREAALQILHGLEEGEWFNVIIYNESVDLFSPRAVRKSNPTLREATTFLEGITPRGGTNIHDALLEALRQPAEQDTLPIVLFMTDGLPTVGQTAESVIRELARKANPSGRRIFTFGVGVDVNTPLLEKIAYENRATATFILPGEDVEAKIAGVFRRLMGPALADPVLTIKGTDGSSHRTRDLIPTRLADLFEGDQIVLLGQYLGETPLECTLRGNYRGTQRTFEFPLNLDHATSRNAFVPRLWASRKIGLLIDAIREQGGNTTVVSRAAKEQTNPATRELVEEIIRLSTEFGILTEYTSFLAKEGTDLSCKDDVRSVAEQQFRSRAIQTRTGLSSVNQDLNNQALKSFLCPNPRNRYLDAEMCSVEVATVQQVCDRTFYKRANQWVDSRLVEQAPAVTPKRVITFGSPEFRALADRLAQEGRQGTIALRGDILMLVDGQPVLIKAP